MVIVKIIILYLIQITHTDDFHSTGKRLVHFKCTNELVLKPQRMWSTHDHSVSYEGSRRKTGPQFQSSVSESVRFVSVIILSRSPSRGWLSHVCNLHRFVHFKPLLMHSDPATLYWSWDLRMLLDAASPDASQVVIPPSHRRRGATTGFGQNRHHLSDTASSFSQFPLPVTHVFFFAVLLRNQGGITAEPRRCHWVHGDPIELPLRFDGGATAIIGGSTAVLAAAPRGQWVATAGPAVLLRWRCGSMAAPWRPRGGYFFIMGCGFRSYDRFRCCWGRCYCYYCYYILLLFISLSYAAETYGQPFSHLIHIYWYQ